MLYPSKSELGQNQAGKLKDSIGWLYLPVYVLSTQPNGHIADCRGSNAKQTGNHAHPMRPYRSQGWFQASSFRARSKSKQAEVHSCGLARSTSPHVTHSDTFLELRPDILSEVVIMISVSTSLLNVDKRLCQQVKKVSPQNAPWTLYAHSAHILKYRILNWKEQVCMMRDKLSFERAAWKMRNPK